MKPASVNTCKLYSRYHPTRCQTHNRGKKDSTCTRTCLQISPWRTFPVPCAVKSSRIPSFCHAATVSARAAWSAFGKAAFLAAAPSAGGEHPKRAPSPTWPLKTCVRLFCTGKARPMHLDPTACAGGMGKNWSFSVGQIRSPSAWCAKPRECTKVTTAPPQKRRPRTAR